MRAPGIAWLCTLSLAGAAHAAEAPKALAAKLASFAGAGAGSRRSA